MGVQMTYHPQGASRRRYIRQQVRAAIAAGQRPHYDAQGRPYLDLIIKDRRQHVICDKRDLATE